MAPWVLEFLYSQFFVTPQYPDYDWNGKTAVVTGSNVGLGYEAVHHLVRLGASKVIIACRSLDKGEAAMAKIIAEQKCSPDVLEVWLLDLMSYESVRQFADRCKTLPRIDAFVENAGIATRNWFTAEGHESTITTNVVSTFYLALLMIPILKQSATKHNIQPRLVIVSSEVHFLTPFKERKNPKIFDALDSEKLSNMGDRYNLSKLLEVYVVREWAHKEKYMGSKDYPIILNMLNPGFCHSELMREVPTLGAIVKGLLARTSEVGSRTLVHAASAGTETHGEFLSDCKPKTPAKLVVGPEGPGLQEKFWLELKDVLEGIQPGITNNF
ncbi:short-chain dehydrogenase/reductase [Aulographum hederae CBS 113979]|uniref:Short-chain dehydrogenase/reductase n=1 Tax=Aulographum hederae CBS 113979 TaxID=1176131 RepID=A0A6G1HBA4_9PEZI|nr:short-chain dehydrogenase/reductase [Aulographum hederae CBS 113979]